jgi:hypothetical protein
MHISEYKHVFEPAFAPGVVSTATTEFGRIPECTEQHIPQRDVGEVMGVMTILVVYPMRLRPLEKISDPGRRLDIPVIKEFADRDQNRVVRGGPDRSSE